jgi:hypothetical protein
MGKTISEIGLIYFIEKHVLGGQTVWEGKRFLGRHDFRGCGKSLDSYQGMPSGIP